MKNGFVYRTLEKFFNLFFPAYFTELVLTEIGIFKVRFFSGKMSRKYKGQKDLLINLGAGDSGQNGWINVDLFQMPGINLTWDSRKKIPFDDESAKGIFTEHYIEHLDYYVEAPFLLKDIYRVLKPGGVVRIIVPDAQKYMEAYQEKGWDALAKVRPLKEGNVDYYSQQVMHSKMELVNWVFRQNYQHKFAYDFDSMAYLLAQAGFKKIMLQDFNRSVNPELIIDNPVRASESLYVEAVKE